VRRLLPSSQPSGRRTSWWSSGVRATAFSASTAHAPGFVGLLGDTPVLSEVARVSAAIYESLEHSSQAGFHRTGGLELAETEEGLTELALRATRAREHGLPAHNLERREESALAPN